MKNIIKYIVLFPVSILYGIVTGIRNWMFDQGILRTTTFDIPIISVGNLAVGGTGKTPHTELIISILQKEWKIAMLSRGYKRETSDFYFADEKTNARKIGDEPYQIHKKFPDISVAVHEKRVPGVKKLLEIVPKLQLIVLDDAFQHRYIHAGLSILLTDYSNMYSRDLVMPAGNLREWRSGSRRADIIIVTKCPTNFKPIEMRLIECELKPENGQSLYFSNYIYDEIVPVFPDSEPENWSLSTIKETKAGVLLVAGIVSPEPIIEQIRKYSNNVSSLFFDDHHVFQSKDYNMIMSKFEAFKSGEKILLVTEKDASRMVSDKKFPEFLKSRTFALPIRVEILNNQESLFIQKIKNYVVENSRNC
ncbi:MAG: tetraacyldisaccharide 4'-kinase [Paludibacter sp.]